MKTWRPACSRSIGVPVMLLAFALAGCSTATAPESPPAPKEVAPPPKARPAPEPAREAPAPAKAPAPKAPAPGKAELELQQGIKSYEDGEYKGASKQLQGALDLGLDSKRDQAKAHKYLAFMVCVTGRERACRDEFNKALDADPNFQLEPSEASHPVWGPALKRVRAERAARAKASKQP